MRSRRMVSGRSITIDRVAVTAKSCIITPTSRFTSWVNKSWPVASATLYQQYGGSGA